MIYPDDGSQSKSNLEAFDIFKKINTKTKSPYKITFSMTMAEGPDGSPTIYEGVTTRTYSPKEFYESALKEGAQKDQYIGERNICD